MSNDNKPLISPHTDHEVWEDDNQYNAAEEYRVKPSYESFFEEVWEYVSESVVDDDMWYKHEDAFQEMTFELYSYYKNTNITLPNGDVHTLVSAKVYSRIIEAFVKNFSKELS